ncbi:MAG: hypothetical protein RLZZ425_240, partial [Bacteroidota bacterium]
ILRAKKSFKKDLKVYKSDQVSLHYGEDKT